MQIKNDYIKIKQGEKEIELHNLILNKYLDLYADSLFNLERKNLDSCLINCTVKETITTNMTEMHWDMFLSEQNAYNNNDFKDSNKIITKYQYEPNYEEQITPLIGRKILSIGFAQMTVEPEMADGSDAEFELYAVLDVSNYNLYIQKEQGFIVQRVDTVTSDLRFNSNTENFPIHLSPRGNSYFDEDMETGTHELAKLTSIGLGYNSKNIYNGTEKSMSQLDFTIVNNEAHIQGMSIEDVDSEGLFPADTLFPANGWEEIIYQSQKAPEVQIDVEEENINIAFEIDGKSIQSETPSPSNPSEIHSVADDVNLFDKETKVLSTGYISSYTYSNGVYTIIPTETGNPQIRLKFILPAGTYTLNSEAYLSIATILRNNNGLLNNFQAEYQNQTFTTTETSTELVFNWTNPNNTNPITLDLRTLKIQKDTEATPYSPYNQGTVTIKQRGKNLANNNFEEWTTDDAYAYIPITLEQGKTYILSATRVGELKTLYYNFGIVKDGTKYSDFVLLRTCIDYTTGDTSTVTFTVDNTYTNPKLVAYVNRSQSKFNELFANYNIQLEERNTGYLLRTISNTTRLHYPNRTIKKST